MGFDPRHDHLTGYVFQTNASAVQADFSLSDDDRFDREYNSVWEPRGDRGPFGAPAKQLLMAKVAYWFNR